MIPSRPFQRRLAVGALVALSLAACGGGEPASPDAGAGVTVGSTSGPGASDTPSVSMTESTTPVGGSSSDTTEAPSAATTAPGTTQPGVTATTSKPGVTTTTVRAGGSTTTVKAGATTTVRTTPTTARPPSTTTPPAPPTTKPASTPGTFTATVANKSHRTLNIPYNSTVVLTVTSATDEEFHVHGYDITKGGTNVTFVFTADMKGNFVVESHDTGWVVCTLVVA